MNKSEGHNPKVDMTTRVSLGFSTKPMHTDSNLRTFVEISNCILTILFSDHQGTHGNLGHFTTTFGTTGTVQSHFLVSWHAPDFFQEDSHISELSSMDFYYTVYWRTQSVPSNLFMLPHRQPVPVNHDHENLIMHWLNHQHCIINLSW